MTNFKKIFAVSFLSLFIISCGNDSKNNTVKISGKAIDGYLSNSNVCLDLNENNLCEKNEPFTKTDEKGNFSLSFEKTNKPVNILVYSGQDNDRIFKNFDGKLKALNINEKVIVSPLSTLQSYYVKEGKTLKEANERIAKLFNISTKQINTDYIASKNKELLGANLNLQYTTDLLQHLGQNIDELYEEIAESEESNNFENTIKEIYNEHNEKENIQKIAINFSKNLNLIINQNSSIDEIKKRMLTYKHKIQMSSYNNIGVYYDYDKHLERLKEIGIEDFHIEYKIPVEVIEGNSNQVLKTINDSKNLEYNENDYKKIFLSDLGIDINDKNLANFNINTNDSIEQIKESNPLFKDKIENNIKKGTNKDSGRLVLTDNSKDKNNVYVFDLKKEKIINKNPIDIKNNNISKIIPSAQYRFALLLENGNNNTDIIDGGLYEEENCDSIIKSDYTPNLFTKSTLSLEINDIKNSNGFMSLYTDEIKEPDGTKYSYASIAEDSDLYSNTQGFLRLDNVVKDGLVEVLGENFVMAVNQEKNSTDKFLYLFKYDKLYQSYKPASEETFKTNIKCENITTSISLEDKTLFTCDKDLILVKRIHNHEDEHEHHEDDDNHEHHEHDDEHEHHEDDDNHEHHDHDDNHEHHEHDDEHEHHDHDDEHEHHDHDDEHDKDIHANDTFKEEKILNSSNTEFTKLFASKYNNQIIAQTKNKDIYSINLDTKKVEKIKVESKIVYVDIDKKTKNLIILDEKGYINFLDIESNFKNTKSINLFKNKVTDIEITKNISNDNIYLLDKSKKQIISINTATYKINDKFTLDFTPNKLTWLGMAGKGYIFKQNRKHCNAAVHDHDHGEH